MTSNPETEYTCEIRTRGGRYRCFYGAISLRAATWDMHQHITPDTKFAARVRNVRTNEIVARAVPKSWR